MASTEGNIGIKDANGGGGQDRAQRLRQALKIDGDLADAMPDWCDFRLPVPKPTVHPSPRLMKFCLPLAPSRRWSTAFGPPQALTGEFT